MWKLAMTTTKKSHATIALAWLRTHVSQHCFGSGSRRGPPLFRYFPTVPGETRIPEFHLQFVGNAFLSPDGIFGGHFPDQIPKVSGQASLPVGWDFQRQNSRNPLRCQRSSVSAFTFTSASRHGNIRLRVTIIHRVESSARRGLTFRSWSAGQVNEQGLRVDRTQQV